MSITLYSNVHLAALGGGGRGGGGLRGEGEEEEEKREEVEEWRLRLKEGWGEVERWRDDANIWRGLEGDADELRAVCHPCLSTTGVPWNEKS